MTSDENKSMSDMYAPKYRAMEFEEKYCCPECGGGIKCVLKEGTFEILTCPDFEIREGAKIELYLQKYPFEILMGWFCSDVKCFYGRHIPDWINPLPFDVTRLKVKSRNFEQR